MYIALIPLDDILINTDSIHMGHVKDGKDGKDKDNKERAKDNKEGKDNSEANLLTSKQKSIAALLQSSGVFCCSGTINIFDDLLSKDKFECVSDIIVKP